MRPPTQRDNRDRGQAPDRPTAVPAHLGLRRKRRQAPTQAATGSGLSYRDMTGYFSNRDLPARFRTAASGVEWRVAKRRGQPAQALDHDSQHNELINFLSFLSSIT